MMISRVAESCFWLQRYIERADCTARLLKVNRQFVLDVDVAEPWWPVIVVVGEQDRFRELFGPKNASQHELVQEYLTWDERNPASLMASVRWARENARTIREILNEEMWGCLNSFWHRLLGPEGREVYRNDRDGFYDEIMGLSARMQGLASNTMMRDLSYDFMQLGGLLERCGQTARILDVKYHMLGPRDANRPESPVELAEWVSLLQTCSAREPFFQRKRLSATGLDVARFLVFEPTFARSIVWALTKAEQLLEQIGEMAPERIRTKPQRALQLLVASLDPSRFDGLMELGIHRELTRIIDDVTEVCLLIHHAYFDPQDLALSSSPLPR